MSFLTKRSKAFRNLSTERAATATRPPAFNHSLGSTQRTGSV